MGMSNRLRWPAVVVALGAGIVLGAALAPTALGRAAPKEQAGAGAPRYTVVFTEGTNLCVTDNQTSKLYFYTIDPGKEPGADLKLRAYVDLTQTGKDVIKPTLTRKKKEGER
jgi:hypothetical protein